MATFPTLGTSVRNWRPAEKPKCNKKPRLRKRPKYNTVFSVRATEKFCNTRGDHTNRLPQIIKNENLVNERSLRVDPQKITVKKGTIVQSVQKPLRKEERTPIKTHSVDVRKNKVMVKSTPVQESVIANKTNNTIEGNTAKSVKKYTGRTFWGPERQWRKKPARKNFKGSGNKLRNKMRRKYEGPIPFESVEQRQKFLDNEREKMVQFTRNWFKEIKNQVQEPPVGTTNERADDVKILIMKNMRETATRRNNDLPSYSISCASLIRINVRIEDYDTSAIIDTGAGVSCVSADIIKKVYGPDFTQGLERVDDVRIKAANGSFLTILGRKTVPLKINRGEIEHPLYVIDKLADNLILGNDLHERAGTMINFRNRSVRMMEPESENETIESLFRIEIDQPEEEERRVEAVDLCVLKPFSEAKVNVLIENRVRSEGLFIFNDKKRDMEFLSEDNEDWITVSNHSPFQRVVYPGTKINLPEVFRLENVKEDSQEETGEKEEERKIKELDEIEEEYVPDETKSPELGLEYDESKIKISPHLREDQREELLKLIRKYREIFSWTGKLEGGKTALGYEQTVPLTDNKPAHQPPYRVSPKERDLLNDQIQEMLKQNVIRKSRSSYAAPVRLIPKADGKFRLVTNYRRLNKVVVPDAYPMPRADDILSHLNGFQYFTTLDMNSGYWQIPIKEEDRHKLAIVTDQGLYEYNVLPFGLKTSGGYFQRCMDTVMAGLKWNTVLIYLDDLICGAESWDDHLRRLESIFGRLKEAKLTLNCAKCNFGFLDIKILGHMVNAKGISPDPAKLEAVKKFPRPKGPRDVRSFLGLASYYRKFIKGFADIAKPLTDLTKKENAGKKFCWTRESEEAFQLLKDKLCKSPVLSHFNDLAELELHTDASDRGLGAVVHIVEGETIHPIAFASRKLLDAERRYSATEKELLAIVWACNYFRHFLWGKKFKVITDHASLKYWTEIKDQSSRLNKLALKLTDFDVDIIHKSGRKHLAPDALSRYPVREASEEDVVEIPTLLIVTDEIGRLQREDEQLKQLFQAIEAPESVSRQIIRKARSFFISNNILYRKNYNNNRNVALTVIPESLKIEVLRGCHDDPVGGGHLGITKTLNKVRARYFWEGLQKEVENYVKSCWDCQSRKRPPGKPYGCMQPIPVGLPFERVAIDYLGPFPKTKDGNKYIITCVDYATKWAEARSVPNSTAEETVKFLIDLICRFGCIKVIQTDRGQTFKSNLVTALLAGLGVRNSFSTAYRPQTQGIVEHYNGTLANMLSMYTGTNQSDWDLYVNMACFSYNASVQESTKRSPFYLLYGWEPTLPIDVALAPNVNDQDGLYRALKLKEVRNQVAEVIRKEQDRQKEQHDARHQVISFAEGEWVKVYSPTRQVGKSDKLQHRYHGPYEIIRKVSPVNYEVEIKRGRRCYNDVVHISRMKKFYPPEDWRNFRDEQGSSTE